MTSDYNLPNARNITRVMLDNGITVLVYENFAAQSVVLSGSFEAGRLLEAPARNGLAALTISSLLLGTEKRDYDAINSALEDIGADIGLSAGVHRSGFYGKSLAEDLPLLIDILNDALREPTFPAAHIERLRGEIMTGLQIRSQDTRFRAGRAFSESLYPPEHPYHYSTRGTLQTVPTLTIDELRAFHARTFGPRGMVIVVVGAVRAAEAIEIIRAKLENWRAADQPVVPALPPLPDLSTTQRTLVPLTGKTQSDLILGVVGPARAEPDYQAAVLANSILGQFGMMGRIGASVREELGLAYYAYSQIEGGQGPGPWSVAAGVNPANVELAIERIGDELRRITSEPVSADDLADNQAYFTGHLPLQLETNEGLAGTIHNLEVYGLGLDYLMSYRARINALTPADLLQAAQHYLIPDSLVVAVAGPEPASV